MLTKIPSVRGCTAMHCSAVHFIALHCAMALKQNIHKLPGSSLRAKSWKKIGATWEEMVAFQAVEH